MHDRRTSTLPVCDRGRRLDGAVVPVAALSACERDQMYALLDSYFRGIERARFDADLREKQAIILLRDADEARIRGFSTLMRLEAFVDGRDVAAFFSGDTIIDRQYWGETILSRLWARTVFAAADRIVSERPDTPVYWFLICSGYKTWKFLPLFFREFYPAVDRPTPPGVQRLLDTLAARKFGPEYLPHLGIVRFRRPTPLRAGIAEITRERLRDPQVAFFTRMNPGHRAGDELACLAELTRANLTRAALRMLGGP
jgi:hypothetical protein